MIQAVIQERSRRRGKLRHLGVNAIDQGCQDQEKRESYYISNHYVLNLIPHARNADNVGGHIIFEKLTRIRDFARTLFDPGECYSPGLC